MLFKEYYKMVKKYYWSFQYHKYNKFQNDQEIADFLKTLELTILLLQIAILDNKEKADISSHLKLF